MWCHPVKFKPLCVCVCVMAYKDDATESPNKVKLKTHISFFYHTSVDVKYRRQKCISENCNG